ncbi:MAG TPA: hypothetical protein P5248_07330, partial [Bacteroidales bacterium]|nr:hypothetical protein [Bacteroidales bacterium]
MHKLITYLLLLLALNSPKALRAQFFSSGQDPASTHWMQLRKGSVRYVYPLSLENEVLRMARAGDSLLPAVSASLDHRPRRIDILVHPSGAVSNGFTTWAPRRIELYPAPPQDQEATDWLRHLLVHEYRHAVQVDKLNQGLTRALGWIFGEQAVGAVLGLYVPLWFLEGDAVVAETMFSRAGRGRLPSFSAPLHAQLTTVGAFPYEKAIFGSYRDFVPDHYILGYHLVAPATLRYGSGVWAGALERSARRPWSLAPMSRSVQRQTGMGLRAWYGKALDEADSLWRSLPMNSLPPPTLLPTAAGEDYASYRRPSRLADGSLLAERSSLADIDRILRIAPDGREEVLASPGYGSRGSLTTGGRRIAWTERRTHPRWETLSWSEIWTLDLSTGQKECLTRRTRLFAPALSPDGDRLLAVDLAPDNTLSLLLLGLPGGVELARYRPPGIHHLMQPAWHPSGKAAVFIAQDSTGRKALVMIRLGTGSLQWITPLSFAEISRPAFSIDRIYFTGVYSDRDALFSVDTLGSAPRLEGVAPFGLTEASPDTLHTALLASAYTSSGYRPVSLPLQKLVIQEEKQPPGPWTALADSLSLAANRLLAVPSGEPSANPRPYRRLPHLFRFHSWGPVAVNADARSANPGISMLSHNLLNTSFLEAGFEYLPAEARGEWYLLYRYQGFFPRLSLEARTGHRSSQAPDIQGNMLDYGWREYRFRLGADLPLHTSSGQWSLGLTPSAHLSHTRLAMDDESPFRFRETALWSLDYRVLAYRLGRRAPRDLQYR